MSRPDARPLLRFPEAQMTSVRSYGSSANLFQAIRRHISIVAVHLCTIVLGKRPGIGLQGGVRPSDWTDRAACD